MRSRVSICMYRIFQPVCSYPSLSRSWITCPSSARTIHPSATATTHASLVTQPAGSPGGAKSIAAQADPESQPPCGPPVKDQVVSGSKGNCIGGCVKLEGNNEGTS